MSYWDTIITWLREDPEISAFLDATFEAEITTEDVLLWKDWAAAAAYQGFDVKVIIKTLHANYVNYMNGAGRTRQTKQIDVVVNGVSKKIEVCNQWSMPKDMQMIIMIFAVRGSTWTKLKDKSMTGLIDYLEWVQEKYDIDETVHKSCTSLSSTDVTIPRIAGCFPGILCKIFHNNMGKELMTLTDIGVHPLAGAAAVAVPISHCILTPYFASMIPNNWMNPNTNYHLVFFLVHLILDTVIHRKTQSYTPLDIMLQYYKAEWNSPATPSASRLTFCKNVGLLSADDMTFRDEILHASPYCESAISAARSQDPSLNMVLAALKSMWPGV